jgi:anti-sigma regulatory factor (Ser/Thr protein kinase)
MTELDALLTACFQLDNLLDVRRDVETLASRCGLEDLRLYYFVVAVNEIMTNAIHHGGGEGSLRIAWLGEFFECEVVDQGPGFPPEQLAGAIKPAADTLSGRGLWLTRQLCDKVDIASDETGTRVTLVFRR